MRRMFGPLAVLAALLVFPATAQAQVLDSNGNLVDDCQAYLFIPTEGSLQAYVSQPRAELDERLRCLNANLIRVSYTNAPDCLPEGHVVSANVGPDTTQPSLPKVDVVISSGRVTPDLSGKTYREASQILRRCNLSAEFLPRAELVGEINKTVPAAGEPLSGETEILVWTVGGKVLPNVLNSNLVDAKTALQAAGFEVGKIVDKRMNNAEWQRLYRIKCMVVQTEYGNVLASQPAPDSVVVFSSDSGKLPKVSLTVEAFPKEGRRDEFCMAEASGTLVP